MVPPVPLLAKVAQHVTTLPVTRLDDPAGAVDQVVCRPEVEVSVNYFAMHYNARFFPNPFAYKPDRFLAADASDCKPANLSFGQATD